MNMHTANPLTITVNGYFGKDKQITKQEFAKVWIDHLTQMRTISWDQAWQQNVDAMIDKTRTQCHAEFDRLYIDQNK
jgi:hypothetical protein